MCIRDSTMSIFTSSAVLGYENDPILGPTGAEMCIRDRLGELDRRYLLGQAVCILIPGPDETGRTDWSRIGGVK